MSENTASQMPPIAVRDMRVQTAVNCQTPDRVPFVPSLGNVYCLEYGVTIKEAMTDIRKVIPAMDEVCREIDPDALFVPTFFPMKTMAPGLPVYGMAWLQTGIRRQCRLPDV